MAGITQASSNAAASGIQGSRVYNTSRSRQLVPFVSAPLINVTFVIATARDRLAGAQTTLIATLYGEKGRSLPTSLGRVTARSGSVITMSVQTHSVGTLEAVKLRNTGYDSWHFYNLTVLYNDRKDVQTKSSVEYRYFWKGDYYLGNTAYSKYQRNDYFETAAGKGCAVRTSTSSVCTASDKDCKMLLMDLDRSCVGVERACRGANRNNACPAAFRTDKRWNNDRCCGSYRALSSSMCMCSKEMKSMARLRQARSFLDRFCGAHITQSHVDICGARAKKGGVNVQWAKPVVTTIASPDAYLGLVTHRLSIQLIPDAKNVYALTGTSSDKLQLPPAYQTTHTANCPIPPTNILGYNPVLLNIRACAIFKFDSYITLGVTNGGTGLDKGKISLVEISSDKSVLKISTWGPNKARSRARGAPSRLGLHYRQT